MSFKVTVQGPTDKSKRAMVQGSGIPLAFVASGETKEFTTNTAPGVPGAIHVSEANA